MEHTNEINKKKEKIAIVTMVGIYLAIILLLSAIVVLVKNIEEISTDPIVYGIKKSGLVICSCYTSQGQSIDYDSEGIVKAEKYVIDFEG